MFAAGCNYVVKLKPVTDSLYSLTYQIASDKVHRSIMHHPSMLSLS